MLLFAELRFEQGENVVEVYVVDAALKGLLPQDTTFAIIDFYDFESQSSPLATGVCPCRAFIILYCACLLLTLQRYSMCWP